MRAEQMLIGDTRPGAVSGDVVAVQNPATDEGVATVPNGGAEDATRGVDAAASALDRWRSRPPSERCERVDRLGRLMLRDTDRLAELMTLEQGKPLREARGEIAYAASFLTWAAGEGVRLRGDILPAPAGDKRVLAVRQAVGVCGIITPWNFPSAMITRKIGPALACGCTVVIKPSELTPLSALAIGELALEAEIPPGVVNVVTGDSSAIGGALFAHRAVRKVSFTGSTAVGSKLIAQSAERVVNLSLELGGHAPLLVFDDADLDLAVEQTVAAKFRNGGQTCIAPNRIYVQSGVYGAFRDALTERVRALRVGIGSDEGVDVGPMINDAAVDKIETHVRDAIEHGAELLCGGERVPVDGGVDRFYAPTVLDGFTSEMMLAQDETFGPVAPLARFESEEEGVALANDSEYGLAAYAFTRDASRLTRVCEALQYGVVGANDGLPSAAPAPFGGFKRSGLGREGGRWAMDEYTETKYISLRVAASGGA